MQEALNGFVYSIVTEVNGLVEPGSPWDKGPLRRLVDRISERLHSLLQDRLRVFTGAVELERAEVFVPIAFGRDRACSDPSLEGQEVVHGYSPFVNSLEEMLPDGAGQISELNLRQ